MAWKKTLFDDDAFLTDKSIDEISNVQKEALPLDRLKDLEEKITTAVEKVKALKEKKNSFERRTGELEALLDEKNQEIEALKREKTSTKDQIEELLNELETLEI